MGFQPRVYAVNRKRREIRAQQVRGGDLTLEAAVEGVDLAGLWRGK